MAREGEITAVVSDDMAVSAALADRLGRYAPGDVTLGGVPLDALPRAVVRRRIVVNDTATALFSGRLHDTLDVSGRSDPAAVEAAVHTASAEDVIDALPEGLDALVEERGRSFSGGQRQRIALARALLTDADVLVLVEPTSAVDAHTEARIAQRLRQHRKGRTTVIASLSPLLLDEVDTVAFIADGKVVASGPHRTLLADVPAYHRVVNREEDA
ncbi:MAG: ABC transporter ATP-binding protein [Nocardioidaceae bacterium]